MYLAAAGVGTLGIIDADVVDRSNLQRQILHTEDRIGTPKVDSAEETLTALNPDVNIVKYRERLTSENVLERDHRLRRDRGRHRQLPHPLPAERRQPGRRHPGRARFDLPVRGLGHRLLPPGGPCYRCQYPEPPPPELAPSCAEGGVLGVLPGVVGTLQATEAVKLLLGVGDPLSGASCATTPWRWSSWS